MVVKSLRHRLSNTWLAIAQGVLSAVAELGAALIFFLFVVPKLTFDDPCVWGRIYLHFGANWARLGPLCDNVYYDRDRGRLIRNNLLLAIF